MVSCLTRPLYPDTRCIGPSPCLNVSKGTRMSSLPRSEPRFSVCPSRRPATTLTQLIRPDWSVMDEHSVKRKLLERTGQCDSLKQMYCNAMAEGWVLAERRRVTIVGSEQAHLHMVFGKQHSSYSSSITGTGKTLPFRHCHDKLWQPCGSKNLYAVSMLRVRDLGTVSILFL